MWYWIPIWTVGSMVSEHRTTEYINCIVQTLNFHNIYFVGFCVFLFSCTQTPWLLDQSLKQIYNLASYPTIHLLHDAFAIALCFLYTYIYSIFVYNVPFCEPDFCGNWMIYTFNENDFRGAIGIGKEKDKTKRNTTTHNKKYYINR